MDFREFLRASHTDLGLEFTVQVLTSGFWPTYTAETLTLPVEMDRCLDVFKNFYNHRTSNRRVTWIHSLGLVQLTGNFAKRRVDLVASTIHAAILLLFNEHAELAIEAIQRHTQLPPEELKKHLKALVVGEFKVLCKRPADGYDPSHVIHVNP